MFGGPGLLRRGQSGQSQELRCFLSALSGVCLPGDLSSLLEVPE